MLINRHSFPDGRPFQKVECDQVRRPITKAQDQVRIPPAATTIWITIHCGIIGVVVIYLTASDPTVTMSSRIRVLTVITIKETNPIIHRLQPELNKLLGRNMFPKEVH
jgi:hypothetical protein